MYNLLFLLGSSSGLGANTAKLFAALGAKVVLHGRSQEGLDRTRLACLDTGCKDHNVRCKHDNIILCTILQLGSLIHIHCSPLIK